MLIFIYGIILARHENLARRKWFIDVLFRYVVYCIINSSSGTSVKPEIFMEDWVTVKLSHADKNIYKRYFWILLYFYVLHD